MKQPAVAFLVTTALAVGAGAARAARPLDGVTVLVACSESIDGAATGRCALEGELMRALQSEGALLVDRAQAETVRAQLSLEKLRSPDGIKGVNLFDADLAFVVDVAVTKALTAPGGTVKSFLVTTAVRVVDVARARITASSDDSVTLMALSGEAALVGNAKRLMSERRAVLLEELARARHAPLDVDVWVFDVPSLAEVELIERALAGTGVVTSAKKTAFTKGIARWRAMLGAGATPDQLALALAQSDVGVVVQGSTGAMLQLAWDPAGRVKLATGLDIIVDKGVPAWFRPVARDLLRSHLAGAGWVDVRDDSAANVDVVAKVRVAPDGGRRGRARVVCELQSKASGRKLAASTEAGAADDLDGILGRAVLKSLDALRAYLATHPKELAAWERMKRAPDALDVQLVPLMPGGVVRTSELARVAADGVVDVKVSGMALDELKARARIVNGDGPAGPTTAAAATASPPAPAAAWMVWEPASASAWQSAIDGKSVRLRLVDDRGAPMLGNFDGAVRPKPARLDVELSGRIGERLYRRTASVTFVVHPPNTVEVDKPETVAALVDVSAPWAAALAKAEPALDGAPTVELARAHAVWRSLSTRGVHYVPDAESPWGSERVDTVPTPADTLRAAGGDVDALAVLLATALEGQALETRLVATPRALLVAVDSGAPASGWPLFAAGIDEVVDVDGRLFLPLDPGALGADLYTAIESGGLALRKDKAKRVVVAPRAQRTVKLQAASLPAPPPRPATEPLRVLVWDVSAPAADASLTSLAPSVHGEVMRALAQLPDLRVLSKKDIKDMLSVEAERRLLGCSDASCFTEIGAAIGAQHVVTGQLGRVDAKPTVDLTLLDTKALAAVARANAVDEGPLLPAVARAARRLARPLLEPRGALLVGDVALLAHVDELARKLPAKDAQRRARFFALADETALSLAEAKRIPDARTRALYEANALLLAGRAADARAAYDKITVSDARVKTGRYLAAAVAGDAAALARLEQELASAGGAAVDVQAVRKAAQAALASRDAAAVRFALAW